MLVDIGMSVLAVVVLLLNLYMVKEAIFDEDEWRRSGIRVYNNYNRLHLYSIGLYCRAVNRWNTMSKDRVKDMNDLRVRIQKAKKWFNDNKEFIVDIAKSVVRIIKQKYNERKNKDAKWL